MQKNNIIAQWKKPGRPRRADGARPSTRSSGSASASAGRVAKRSPPQKPPGVRDTSALAVNTDRVVLSEVSVPPNRSSGGDKAQARSRTSRASVSPAGPTGGRPSVRPRAEPAPEQPRARAGPGSPPAAAPAAVAHEPGRTNPAQDCAAPAADKEVGPGSVEQFALRKGLVHATAALSPEERQYIRAVDELLGNRCEASLARLNAALPLVEPRRGPLAAAVEEGMLVCAHLVHDADAAVAGAARGLALKHWRIMPDGRRRVHAPLVAEWADDLQNLLQTGPPADTRSVLSLWSLLLKQGVLSGEQCFGLYTRAVALVMRAAREPLSDERVAMATELCVQVFAAAGDDEPARLELALHAARTWIAEDGPPRHMAYLIVRQLAAVAQTHLAPFVEARDGVNLQQFKAAAVQSLECVGRLCHALSRLVLDEVLESALRKRRMRLLTQLVADLAALLWTSQLAPAESFLIILVSKALERPYTHVGDARFAAFVQLLLAVQQTAHLCEGESPPCAPAKIVSSPSTAYQLLYLATLQCAYDGASTTEIFAAIGEYLDAPAARGRLTPDEWRSHVRHSRLPEQYRAVTAHVKTLARAHHLPPRLHVSVLRALEPVVRANPAAHYAFVLSLLDGLAYVPPGAGEALVGIAGAALRPHDEASLPILRRVGVRLVIPNTGSLPLRALHIVSDALGAAASRDVRVLAFVVMLAVLADATPALTPRVIALLKPLLLTDEPFVAHAPPPTPDVTALLRQVTRSSMVVKTGLAKLLAAVKASHPWLPTSWMTWYVEQDEAELVCLLAQFGAERVPKARLLALASSLEPGQAACEPVWLKTLAAGLHRESQAQIMDPAASHEVFASAYEALLAGTLPTPGQVDCAALAIKYAADLCQSEVQSQRRDVLRELIRVATSELEAVERGLSRRDSGALRDAASSHALKPGFQYLPHLVLVAGCTQHWTCIDADSTRRVARVLVALLRRIAPDEELRSMIVRTLFGILSRRAVWLDMEAGLEHVLRGIVAAPRELDTLVDVLLSWEWPDAAFRPVLLDTAWLGDAAVRGVMDRILDTRAAFRDRPRFAFIVDRLRRDAPLLEHCMPKIIALCFVHHAPTAQCAIELCVNLGRRWARSQIVRSRSRITTIMQGLEIASQWPNRHAAPLSRLWRLLEASLSSSEQAALVSAVARAIISLGTADAFAAFLMQGLKGTGLKRSQARSLQEALLMEIILHEHEPLEAAAAKRLRMLQTLEEWIAAEYVLERTRKRTRKHASLAQRLSRARSGRTRDEHKDEHKDEDMHDEDAAVLSTDEDEVEAEDEASPHDDGDEAEAAL